jgi:hypothetical protein
LPSSSKPRTPAIDGDDGGYKAFVPKMASKNMMNDYRQLPAAN